jgi:hypothetical protein
MYALISMNELVSYGYRVAQVVQNNEQFPVAERMFWFPCGEDVVADKYYYDPATSKIIKIEENN